MKIKLTAFFTAIVVGITFLASAIIANASLQDAPVSIEYTDDTAEQWDGKTRKTITKDCTITVNNNYCIFDEPIIISENVKVTVHGGNNTVSIKDNYLTKPALLFGVAEGAELTVENLNVGNTKDLTITDSNGTAHSLNFINSYGSLTLNNVNFSITNGCVVSSAGTDANLEINGGKIVQEFCQHGAIRNGAGIANISNLRLSMKERYAYGINNQSGGTMELNSCNLTNCGIYNSEAVLNVRGGTIKNESDYDSVITNDGGTLNVYDGTINGIYNSNYKTKGITNIYGGDITWGDENEWAVINVGKIYIKGGTVQTLYNSGYDDEPYGYAEISEDGKIISDTNAITNYGEVYIKGGEVYSGYKSGIYNYGSLSIEDGDIVCEGNYAIQNYENADLEISGGTIEAASYVLYNRPGGSASISGGKLAGVNPSLWNNGTLDITNGEITSESDNPVVNNGTLSISGGSFGGPEDSEEEKYIKNNKGVMKLSGAPIFNNTSLWLASDDNIEIAEEITYNTPCKIYVSSSFPRIFTSGWSVYMGEKNPSDYFESPYSLRIVAQTDGEAVLRPFIITFNANGGICETESTFVNYKNGQALLIPKAKRDNYVFDGWFTEEESGEKVTEDTVFTGDIELYAHWSECEHVWSDTYESDSEQHWKVCTKCGTHESNIDHDWKIDEVLQSPNCTEGGRGKFVCADCGREKTDDIPIDADAHEWGDWTMILEPTKTDKGTIQRKCDKNPEHIETEEIPELTEEEFWTLTDSKEPGCTEDGYEIYECEYGTVKITLPAPGYHISETDERVEPTCVDTGLTKGSHCKVCGKVLTEQTIIDKLGHDWDEGENTKAPTCTENGVKTFTCFRCSETKTEKVDAAGHTEVIDKAVPATCTEKGKTAGSHCNVCGITIVEQTDIDALGHDWGEGEITNAPTCTENGVMTFTCSRCGETETKDIEAAGHMEVTDEAIPATCTESGKTEGSHCGICGAVIEAQEETPALGHSWDDGEITKQPTADEAGEKTFTCTVCDKTKIEIIPATGGTENSDNGSISKEVQSGENVPDTKLETPLDELVDAVLTPEEQELVEEGVEIKIVLTVEDGTDSVPAEDKEKIETVIDGLSGCTLGQYLDIHLLKIIGDFREEIAETNALITIVFEIPEALRSEGRTYSVIRVHEGETAVLSDLDSDIDTLTIKTDKFSTYALVYIEKSGDTPPAESSSDSSEPTPPAESSSDGSDPTPPAESSSDGSDPAPPDESSSDGSDPMPPAESSSDVSDPTPPVEIGSDSNEPIPPAESGSDSSNSALSESEPSESGNTTSDVSGEASGSVSASPNEENPSTDESKTNPNGSTTSSGENSSAPNGSVAGDNGENPSTGIVAVSLVPLATAIAVLAASAKRKRK